MKNDQKRPDKPKFFVRTKRGSTPLKFRLGVLCTILYFLYDMPVAIIGYLLLPRRSAQFLLIPCCEQKQTDFSESRTLSSSMIEIQNKGEAQRSNTFTTRWYFDWKDDWPGGD